LRQDVLSGSQSEGGATNGEVNVLKARVAAGGNLDQAGGGINGVAGNIAVKGVVGGGLDVDEGGSGINNTRKGTAADRLATIADASDINTPVSLN
jgi:hypothetical protein